jgi:DNA-directed RNA polymerase specialized sigma24 family protein
MNDRDSIGIEDMEVTDLDLIRTIKAYAWSYLASGCDVPRYMHDELSAYAISRVCLDISFGVHLSVRNFDAWFFRCCQNAFRDFREKVLLDKWTAERGRKSEEEVDRDRERADAGDCNSRAGSLPAFVFEATILLDSVAGRLDAIEYVFARMKAEGWTTDEISREFDCTQRRVQRKLRTVREVLGLPHHTERSRRRRTVALD